MNQIPFGIEITDAVKPASMFLCLGIPLEILLISPFYLVEIKLSVSYRATVGVDTGNSNENGNRE
jgi:hypothetical protein